MLDIRFVRDNADIVKDDLKKRKLDEKVSWVDAVLEKDKEWRSLKMENDKLRAERNKVSKGINEAKKAGKDVKDLIEKAKSIPGKIEELDGKMETLQRDIKGKLMRLPNITHEDVPVGDSDEENVEVEKYGKRPEFQFRPKNHTELIGNFVELERAAKIAGSRFYFLKGDLALLEHAIQAYGLRFMSERGYTPVMPPSMMNREAYEGVTDLADFEDVLYKIEEDDLHLIATSEHPLTAQYMGETLTDLPVRLAGISPCYRTETGSHGKEEKGIWRVHQFNKVEQIVICKPEDSWKFHDEITKNAIDFFESLGLHFRKVLICTGDLGIVAAKKFDLEAWIPSVEKYKEVVSSSNCTSYQAVRLGIRYDEKGETDWVHTLNSTCVATSRALVAILEQYQQEDGSIIVPDVLRPFMGGKKSIKPSS